jgi:hypothetical protein
MFTGKPLYDRMSKDRNTFVFYTVPFITCADCSTKYDTMLSLQCHENIFQKVRTIFHSFTKVFSVSVLNIFCVLGTILNYSSFHI